MTESNSKISLHLQIHEFREIHTEKWLKKHSDNGTSIFIDFYKQLMNKIIFLNTELGKT